ALRLELALLVQQLPPVVGADAPQLRALPASPWSDGALGDRGGLPALARSRWARKHWSCRDHQRRRSRKDGLTMHDETRETSPNSKLAKPLRPLPIDEAGGVIDEVQAWFLAQAERDGWVYTSVLRQLVNRMYRDRDYQEKRKVLGRR